MTKKGSGKSTNTLNLKGKGLAVKQLKGFLVLLGMGNFLTLPARNCIQLPHSLYVV